MLCRRMGEVDTYVHLDEVALYLNVYVLHVAYIFMYLCFFYACNVVIHGKIIVLSAGNNAIL
jgi:hypothetical protein